MSFLTTTASSKDIKIVRTSTCGTQPKPTSSGDSRTGTPRHFPATTVKFTAVVGIRLRRPRLRVNRVGRLCLPPATVGGEPPPVRAREAPPQPGLPRGLRRRRREGIGRPPPVVPRGGRNRLPREGPKAGEKGASRRGVPRRPQGSRHLARGRLELSLRAAARLQKVAVAAPAALSPGSS